MLQSSPTLSPGREGQSDCAATPRVPVPFCHFPLHPFPSSPQSAISSLTLSLSLKPPLLTLDEFLSPPADEMLHRFSLCGDEMGGRRDKEGVTRPREEEEKREREKKKKKKRRNHSH